jgi:hypothetical protein
MRMQPTPLQKFANNVPTETLSWPPASFPFPLPQEPTAIGVSQWCSLHAREKH